MCRKILIRSSVMDMMVENVNNKPEFKICLHDLKLVLWLQSLSLCQVRFFLLIQLSCQSLQLSGYLKDTSDSICPKPNSWSSWPRSLPAFPILCNGSTNYPVAQIRKLEVCLHTSFSLISIFHEVLLILFLKYFTIPSLQLHCLLTSLLMSTHIFSTFHM